jgi:hypothetical protein
MPMDERQRIAVFQQNASGEAKIKGIERYGGGRFDIQTISIDAPLPPIIDDTARVLPEVIHADLVLDFLAHPDLSWDLTDQCRIQAIPVVASGRKERREGVHTPPT